MYKTEKFFTPAEIAAKAKRTGATPILMKSMGMNIPYAQTFAIAGRARTLNSMKAPKGIDQQIYDAVYSAEDLCLEVANRLISAPLPEEEKKYARLLALNELGFSNTEQVKEIVAYQKKVEAQKELVAAIELYRREYPLYKFIDLDGVKDICAKYNLLLAGVDKYKSDIPEKNQIDIVNFRVKTVHVRKATEIGNWFEFSDYFGSIIKPRRVGTSMYDGLWGNRDETQGKGFDGLLSTIENNEPKSDIAMAMGMALLAQKDTEKTPGKNLLIMAPEHKLETKGNMKKGHILLNDPIVLQPVHHGYLIVTSWGFEAADPAIANPINN